MNDIESELNHCPSCNQMTNWKDGQCQKCGQPPVNPSTDSLAKVTRITVVDHTEGGEGIVIEKWDVNVELSLQDNSRTLKVFIKENT